MTPSAVDTPGELIENNTLPLRSTKEQGERQNSSSSLALLLLLVKPLLLS
jgi:hypothetical protein